MRVDQKLDTTSSSGEVRDHTKRAVITSFRCEQRSKPLADIPVNPDWCIGILILAYYNPNIIG